MVTDRQIRLLRDWDVIEPSELSFGCGSAIAAAHSLKLIRICGGANIVKVGEGRGGWSRGGTMSLKVSDVAVINDS